MVTAPREPASSPSEASRLPDHIVVLDGATWADYQRALEMRGERRSPRIAYLEGRLELMSSSRMHETTASVLGCLVEAWCMDRGLDLTPVGSWTLEKKAAERGLEPDECYVFGDRDDIDEWERPDLAIEVVWTSGGLSKLEIYRKLGVPEVWTWRKARILAHRLEGGRYVEIDQSDALPEIDLSLLARLAEVRPMTRAVRELRAQAPASG
jgi:Uma2 family endonuclease